MYSKGNPPVDKIKIPVLNAVSLIFKTISFFNLKRKARRPREFPALIVSIDNLSFGGTGKTTLVTELGTQLERKNIKFAVVTRGYKSKYEHAGTRVRPTHDFTDVGDEAEIYKTRFPGQDIYVGKDRVKSIENAVRDNNKIILLDDGFQSANIRKDITVMLLNPYHPYYYLRNFKFLIKKEDFILIYSPGVTPREGQAVPAPYPSHAPGRNGREPAPPVPVFGTYDFVPEGFFDPAGNPVDIGTSSLSGFSALGDNRRFKNDLSAFNLAEFTGFADHHVYTQNEIKTLDNRRREINADHLACTEKDFIKLKRINLTNIPLIYFRNSIKLDIDLMDVILDYAEKENYI